MNVPKRRAEPLLTLREAARRLGVPNSVFVDLVYLHPPVIEVTLVGRAPRVDPGQIASLARHLVRVVMELIRTDSSLLGLAMAFSRRRSAAEESMSGDMAALRHIIALEAAQARLAKS